MIRSFELLGYWVARLQGCSVAGRGEPGNQATQQASNLRPRVLILAGEKWHRGVIGLTAGRIAQKYHRPTLVISTDGDEAAGSARSIPTINLHEQLERAADLFAHFGGHEFACGFALPSANVPRLRERLEDQFESLDPDLFRCDAAIDAALDLATIDRSFVDAHELLQPFGAGNPQPLFLARGVDVIGRRTFAPDCVELTLRDATGGATAVMWPSQKFLDATLASGRRVDFLFHVEADGHAVAGARLAIIDARNSADS